MMNRGSYTHQIPVGSPSYIWAVGMSPKWPDKHPSQGSICQEVNKEAHEYCTPIPPEANYALPMRCYVGRTV